MANLATGHAELKKAAGDMMNANGELQGQLSQLATAVDAVQGAWKGDAQIAFTQLMARYQEDAKKLNDSLANIAEAVSGSADIYQQQEEEAARSVSEITQALG